MKKPDSPLRSILFAGLVLMLCFVSITTGSTLTAGAATSFLTTACASLTSTPKQVLLGTHGTILFTCNNSPALTVSKPGIATPHFTLQKGYQQLTIVSHSSSTTCTLGKTLLTGVSLSFSVIGAFDYCASFNNPSSNLATFSLTWTRP